MKNNIQMWGKLAKKQQVKQYDLGGILGSTATGVAGGIAGGPATMIIGGVTGLLGGLANNAKEKQAKAAQQQQEMMQKQSMFNSMPKSGGGLSTGMLAYGGFITPDVLAKSGIHIKPENRGKFTATKKATGKSTEELTHSKNPLTRKRAIFAQNARKWQHADGGYMAKDGLTIPPDGGDDDKEFMDYMAKRMATDKELGTLGNDPKIQKQLRAEFEAERSKTKPVGQYNAKGTSLGMEKKTKPEATTWYPNSAALSQYKQLKQSGRMDEANKVVFGHYGTEQYGGPYNVGTHGEAEKQGLVYPVRYNELNTLQSNPKYKGNLPKDYEALKQGVNYAKGGFVNPLANSMNGLVTYQGGGTHSQNPLGGIPLGQSAQGQQNSVEQGESSFKFKDGKYVFSNRLKLRK